MKRPFKGLMLRDGPMASYDAVIVGAGIGGLIAANLLARGGLRVLVAEQHYMVGGYCSTFRRKGYTFDAATHFYPLLGNPSTITGRLLVELGISCGWVKMDPVDDFHFPDGSRFSVPADFAGYLAKLKAEFPDEARALDEFFGAVREAYLLGLLHYFKGRDTKRLDRYREMTLRQALDRYFQSPKLKLLLTGDCPHWGAPPCRTSFVFDSMLRLSYFLGNYYPSGGSQAFSDELAQRFEQAGGHVLTCSPVRRILIKDGAACGVEIETGPARQRVLKQVRADVVVSNADILLTLERMVGAEHLEADYIARVRKLRPTYPCFLMHIGLKGFSAEALRDVQGYYWNSWDPDEAGRGSLKFKVFVPTLYDPGLAPHGRHVVIIQKIMEMDYAQVGDWPSHKARAEHYVKQELERLLPGFSKGAEVMMSASALTSHRYTLNHHGAMLGWEMSPEQLGARRPGIEGPVSNLYFTGHWTQPGGGITPVIVSALHVAKRITGREVLGLATSQAAAGQGKRVPEAENIARQPMPAIVTAPAYS